MVGLRIIVGSPKISQPKRAAIPNEAATKKRPTMVQEIFFQASEIFFGSPAPVIKL